MANCIACRVAGKRKKATKGKLCEYHYEENKSLKRLTTLPLRDYWYSLMGRCYKPHWKLYNHYGAKGYTVCQEWHDRKTFTSWAVAQGYRKGKLIKLKEGCIEYNPENCFIEEK